MKNNLTLLLIFYCSFLSAQVNWNYCGDSVMMPSSLRIASGHGNTVFAFGTRVSITENDQAGIYRSDDEAKSWQTIDLKLPRFYDDIYCLAKNGNKLFAYFYFYGSGVWGGEILISADSGKTWSYSSAGIDSLDEIHGIVALTANEMVAAGGRFGSYKKAFYKSNDGGLNWSPISSSGIPINEQVIFFTKEGSRFYAATTGKHFYYSDDNLQTWKSFVNFPATRVQGMATADGKKLYVAGIDQLFVSNDTGATWQSHTANFGQAISFYDNLLYKNGTYYIVAATHSSGGRNKVFKSQPNTPPTGIAATSKASVSVYPNPATNALSISIAAPTAFVRLFNMRGEVIYSQQYISGEHIDVAGLSAGIYFIQVTTGNELFTAKFVKE